MSSVSEHKKRGPKKVQACVLTVSDTRDMQTDSSGQLICRMLEENGHRVVARRVVPDEIGAIQAAVRDFVGANPFSLVLVTGGTGISYRDVTVQALVPLFDKELRGFGEIFRLLSYQEIGAAAMLSRATAGIVRSCAVFAMPGSRAAVSLAMSRIVLPEAGHMVHELRKNLPGDAAEYP